MSTETTTQETTGIPANATRPESRLTRSDVDGLELFDRLVEESGRGRTTLVREVVAPTPDPRRLFRGAQRQRIWDRCGGKCWYCNHQIADGETWFGDHVIPHAHGGQTVDLNGVVACFSCNSAKSDKVW